MTYYHYDPDANHYNGYAVRPEDEEAVLSIHFDDGPLPNNPVRIGGFDDNPGLEADFSTLNNYRKIPIVNQRAWDVLLPLIGEYADALPVLHPSGKPFYFIHVKNVIDCVDLNVSEVDRYSDGRVMKIIKYRLKLDLVKGIHIFKTPRRSGGDVLVDDAFRGIVESNHLTGLRFRPIPTI